MVRILFAILPLGKRVEFVSRVSSINCTGGRLSSVLVDSESILCITGNESVAYGFALDRVAGELTELPISRIIHHADAVEGLFVVGRHILQQRRRVLLMRGPPAGFVGVVGRRSHTPRIDGLVRVGSVAARVLRVAVGARVAAVADRRLAVRILAGEQSRAAEHSQARGWPMALVPRVALRRLCASWNAGVVLGVGRFSRGVAVGMPVVAIAPIAAVAGAQGRWFTAVAAAIAAAVSAATVAGATTAAAVGVPATPRRNSGGNKCECSCEVHKNNFVYTSGFSYNVFY